MDEAVYNAKNQYIGKISMDGNSGEAYDKHGMLIGSYYDGMTYRKGRQPYGRGNLLEALVYSEAEQ